MTQLLTNIYTLHDPCGELRYVGKTVHPVGARLRRHLTTARSPKSKAYSSNWIRSLLAQDKVPEVRLLQTVAGDHWVEAERYWISHFRAQGCRLTNLADGGQGASGYRHAPEVYERIAAQHRGRKRSPETRALMSAAAFQRVHTTRRPCSEETKAKISRAQQQRDNAAYLVVGLARRIVDPEIVVAEHARSADWVEKIKASSIGSHAAQAKLDVFRVAEMKRLLLDSELSQDKIAEKFGVSRTLVGLIQRNKRWNHVPWPSVAGTMYADLPDTDDDSWMGL